MSTREVNITNEWLHDHMKKVREHHLSEVQRGRPSDGHHGIVPDLINEILRPRGEPIIEFEWASYPDFVKGE